MKKVIYRQSFSKKDRSILIENTKKANLEYLLEIEGGQDYLNKCKQDPNLPIYLVGIIQKGDAPNRNGRIYPFAILKKECDRYMKEDIREGQSFGELDHPLDSSVPELKNAAFTIEDIWYKGTEVWGRIKLLNAYMPETASGKLARGIVLNGKTLGISSRALGSTYQNGSGYDIVDEDLEIICWDLVSKPSTYDANLRLTEGQKKKSQSKLLTEKRCFGSSCNINTSKKIITEKKLHGLSLEQKTFLNILGVEKYLQINKNK